MILTIIEYICSVIMFIIMLRKVSVGIKKKQSVEKKAPDARTGEHTQERNWGVHRGARTWALRSVRHPGECIPGAHMPKSAHA